MLKKTLETYGPDLLPAGIRSRFVSVNGLNMHILEAGYETPGRPLVLLLHGFPELAYSWRRNLLPLAKAGYYVVAPDQRGFGRTDGWERGYQTELHPFGNLNLVTDLVELTSALGYRRVHAVVGHDSGVQPAAMAALIRPDLFRSVVMMAAPFPGVAQIPLGREGISPSFQEDPIHQALAGRKRPRRHYQIYYSSPGADSELRNAPQGLRSFLRTYFFCKSADWKKNRPFRLADWSAEELEKMPSYYIMDLDKTMAETMEEYTSDLEKQNGCQWLTEQDLDVYSQEYGRTGFQGGLNWYRCGTGGLNAREAALFSGKKIEVPSLFIAGMSDWCPFQIPGYLETMANEGCTDFHGCHFVEGAGHWVQQEQPDKVNELLLRFLDGR